MAKILFLISALGLTLMVFAAWKIPASGQKYAKIFKREEKNNGLPNNLLARVAYQESKFRPEIINGSMSSIAGAKGIMQIIPKWHPNVDPLDPLDAIPYAAGYLKNLYNKFGSWSDALAAYNWGEGNLKRWKKNQVKKIPLETQKYVSEIMRDVFGI